MPTETRVAAVPAFGIEVEHPRNCDLLIQSIPGCRLRSRIKSTITTTQGITRAPVINGVPPPEVPGMQLHVDPLKLSYVVYDPLNDDEAALHRVKEFLRTTAGIRQDTPIRGVATIKGTLDSNRMKTLCREIVQLIEAGHVKVIKGPAPDAEDVNELPGEYLLNPGSVAGNSMPQFERDYDAWKDKINCIGG